MRLPEQPLQLVQSSGQWYVGFPQDCLQGLTGNSWPGTESFVCVRPSDSTRPSWEER